MNILRMTCTRNQIKIVVSLFLLVGLLSVAGCGTQTYEERLKLTETYYDYIDRLNRNLGPQFQKNGVTMRVPIQFTEIPAPARRRSASAQGESTADDDEEVVDPRQPDYLDIELPGLVAAWKADLNSFSSGGDGEPAEEIPGYLYLLSNYDYWATFKTAKEIGDPTKFHDEVIDKLIETLQISVDRRARGSASDPLNKPVSLVVPEPKDEQFVPRKEFVAYQLAPDPEADVPQREYRLYLHQNGDIKIALLYILPQNVGAGEQLPDRILMALQTVNVSSEKPRRSGKASAAGNGNDPKPPASGANF